jgi:phosphoenolpyruvate carboxykinase (ATP)
MLSQPCVDLSRSAVTENTRASYPIDYIPNARIPCVGPHPKNLILLCCDAFGVLPPVSRLTKEQAMYHFISGYTAKVHISCISTEAVQWPPISSC